MGGMEKGKEWDRDQGWKKRESRLRRGQSQWQQCCQCAIPPFQIQPPFLGPLGLGLNRPSGTAKTHLQASEHLVFVPKGGLLDFPVAGSSERFSGVVAWVEGRSEAGWGGLVF